VWAAAFSAWPLSRFEQSPVVNTLLGLGTVLLVLFLIALSLDEATRLRRFLGALLLLVHYSYIASYARAYGLTVHLYPLLDVFTDAKGHASAVLDVGQLMIIYLAASLFLGRRKAAAARNINPSSGEGPEMETPRPGNP